MNNFADLSIIIPTINERENLEELIFILNRKYPGSHIFICDDGSTDGTELLIEEIVASSRMSRIYFMARHRNEIITNNAEFDKDLFYKDQLGIRYTRGLTASVIDAISLIPTENFIVIDADFQHPPELVGKMYEKLQDSDLVAAWRQKLEGFPVYRKLITKTGNLSARFALPSHSRVKDPLSGAFGGSKKKLENVFRQPDNFRLEGFKVLFDLLKVVPEDAVISEAGYDFKVRKKGESKIGLRHFISFYASLFDEKKGRLIAGFAIVFFLAAAGGGLALIYGDYSISAYMRNFAENRPAFLNLCEFITDYGNYLYYSLFLFFIIYGAATGKKALFRVGLLYIAVQLVASILITGSLKIIIGRPRPGRGFEFQFFTDSSRFKSFPSGHATDAFASAGVMWGFLRSYPLVFVSFFYSVLIGISRVFVGSHYFVDVIAGMVIGFVTGVIIIHRKLTLQRKLNNF